MAAVLGRLYPEGCMASKFGKLGDLDNLLSEIRLRVRHAASTIHNIRHGLYELSPEKAAELLLEAEKQLDEITGG